ncbi:MAG: hypothetical protein NZ743_09385 [Pseudomonadales bacterium]|nr:hypothetical protein [Pseudomonadales bacterium]
MAANKRRIWQQRLRAFGGGLEPTCFSHLDAGARDTDMGKFAYAVAASKS